jgi:excisionase family DNA binding protein
LERLQATGIYAVALIDAKAAAELLAVPRTWILEEARHDRIPHIRLGRYVRFDAEMLLEWSRNRARGPIIRVTTDSGAGDDGTSRRPTPDLTRRTDAP